MGAPWAKISWKDTFTGKYYSSPTGRTVEIGPIVYKDIYDLDTGKYLPVEKIVSIASPWGKMNSHYQYVGGKYVFSKITFEGRPSWAHARISSKVPSLYDFEITPSATTRTFQQSYRIETYGGMTKITPLPISAPPTFSATWKTIKINDTIYKYPSVDWSNIPKTNWSTPQTNWSIPSTNWNRRY